MLVVLLSVLLDLFAFNLREYTFLSPAGLLVTLEVSVGLILLIG